VLDPVPAQGDPLVPPLYEKTVCTFTVRDIGAPARPVKGPVTVSQSVPEGGFDTSPPDTCSVVPTPTPGVSKCSMTYRADPTMPGFVFRAPQTTFSSAYAGETTHNGSPGGPR
jgi:hypothetical protein